MAFVKAIEAGADMIELDCQLSKDGHVVVIHDERLDRTAGARGPVCSKTLKQLKKLDVGARFKRSFKGQQILTLEEVMDTVAGRVELNLDIKTAPRGPLGIELKVLFILSHYHYLERSVLSSFDYRVLRQLRELAPEAVLGVLYGRGVTESPLRVAEEIGAYSVHVEKELATPQFLEQASRMKLKRFVWTLNEVAEMERFLALWVEGIVSDFPEKFWKIRPKLGRARPMD
ncbi:MAG: glycerophosphodiester phosphodiesterase [Deltaproteobacteria bacterium]|nr:glycerophosphodiester phosphodiesterase [Deltaproteobacteria bacterium]